MAAEVGLLTRNIRVIGNDYNKLFEQSFGTRVIIGTVPGDTGDFVGKNISSFKLKFYTDFQHLVFILTKVSQVSCRVRVNSGEHHPC